MDYHPIYNYQSMMNKSEITEGNKLMARFLGYEYFPLNNPCEKHGSKNVGWLKPNSYPIIPDYYLGRSHKSLRFDTDWNWLMRVVNLIESNFSTSISVTKNTCIVYVDGVVVSYSCVEKDKITSVWKACLTYIKSI